MNCEILVSTKQGQKVAGTVSFNGVDVVQQARPGYENLMKNVMKSPVINGEKFTREENPEEWFKNLPAQYSGSYVRARMVGKIDEGWVTINGHHILLNDPQDHEMMLGVAPYRTQGVADVKSTHMVFNRPEVMHFKESIAPLAKNYDGVRVDKIENAAGVWKNSREASFLIEGMNHGESEVALDAYAAKLGSSAPERQMAMARFTADEKGTGAAYELHGVDVNNEEKAVGVLLKHGFEGMTVPLSTGRVILFDENKSMGSKMDAAAKELGLNYSVTPGHVRFIGENDYKAVQNEYRQAHGQPAEEIYNSYVAQLQEVQRQLQGLAQTVNELTEGATDGGGDGDGHWVTINGHPVFIGGGSVPPQFFKRDITRIANGQYANSKFGEPGEPRTFTRTWENPLQEDIRRTAVYFNRLTQDQLLEAHAIFQDLQHQSNFAPQVLPMLISRMDDGHAHAALAQSTGTFHDLTEESIVHYGPAKAAEQIINANPHQFPLYSADPSIGRDGLVNAWKFGGGISKDQIRMQYAAGRMEPNANSQQLNYWAERRGIAPNTVPAQLIKNMDAEYQNTQKFYADKGVDSVTLYRGSTRDVVTHSPLEFWTTNLDLTVSRAGEFGNVLTATVPRSSIFWSHESNPAVDTNLNRQEFTVFGGSIKGIKSNIANEVASPAQKQTWAKEKDQANKNLWGQDWYKDYYQGMGPETEL